MVPIKRHTPQLLLYIGGYPTSKLTFDEILQVLISFANIPITNDRIFSNRYVLQL